MRVETKKKKSGFVHGMRMKEKRRIGNKKEVRVGRWL